MDIPKLPNGKCSVLIAEYATGHVFKKDLTIYYTGQDESEIFDVYENFDTAKNFAVSFVKSNPKFECAIHDHLGEHKITIDPNGER